MMAFYQLPTPLLASVQVEHQQFALRFKSSDIALEFKSHVDRVTKEAVLNSSASVIETPPSSPAPGPAAEVQSPVVSSSSDCQLVDEVLPDEDLVALAEKYQLPKSFYNYLKKAPCPGCAGCEDENAVSSTTTATTKEASVEKTPPPPQEEKGVCVCVCVLASPSVSVSLSVSVSIFVCMCFLVPMPVCFCLVSK